MRQKLQKQQMRRPRRRPGSHLPWQPLRRHRQVNGRCTQRLRRWAVASALPSTAVADSSSRRRSRPIALARSERGPRNRTHGYPAADRPG